MACLTLSFENQVIGNYGMVHVYFHELILLFPASQLLLSIFKQKY